MFERLFKSKTQPVEIANTSAQAKNRSQFIRNVNRLVILYTAVVQGDSRSDVLKEIEERKKICLQFGHDEPQNLEQARSLQEKVNTHAN